MIKLWMPSWIQSNFSATKQQQQPSTIHPLATSTAHTWNQAWLNHSSENKYQKERGDYWERDTRRFPSIIAIQSSNFLTLLIKSKCTWNQRRCPLPLFQTPYCHPLIIVVISVHGSQSPSIESLPFPLICHLPHRRGFARSYSVCNYGDMFHGLSTTMTFINGGFCARFNPYRNKGTFDRSASVTFVIWISSLVALNRRHRTKEESRVGGVRILLLSLAQHRSFVLWGGQERSIYSYPRRTNELNWADGGICTSPSSICGTRHPDRER